MLLVKANAQLGDRGRSPLCRLLAHRIGAEINITLDPFGLLARGGGGPVRECADGRPPLQAIGSAAVVHHEGLGATARDPATETLHVGVPYDASWRHQPLDRG